MPVDVGFAIHPDDELLDRCAPLLASVDYLEVAPETTWFERPDGALVPNGFAERFRALGDRYGKPFVAHGVGLSLGDVDDGPRRARWLARVEADQATFGYRWYTDHAGMTHVGGQSLALPLPAPLDAGSAARTRARLEAMKRVCPTVGLETTAQCFVMGDPLDEPAWLAAAIGDDPSVGVLLDVHNVFTMAQNLGFDPRAYLARLDLSRVIELHVSGGSASDPRWLPSGRSVRLDSHDDAVPEAVFALLAEVAPRCPRLRGVTLERMEGTVTSPEDVDGLRRELARVRTIADAHPGPKAEAPPIVPSPPPRAELGDPAAVEAAMARALRARDPVAAWTLGHVDQDGLRIAALLVAKLRFERTVRGSREASDWFDRDPAAMSRAFRAYHQAEPIRASFPAAEGAGFEAWLARHELA